MAQTLETFYDRLGPEAKAQVDRILSTGQAIEAKPAQPTYGKFQTKITDLETINFSAYPNGKNLEQHLTYSGFAPHSPQTRQTLERFYASDYGKSTIPQTALEDLY